MPALALLLVGGAFWLFASTRPVSPAPSPSSGDAGDAWLSVYLTDPSGPQADSLRGGPDARLAEAIDAARYSVDVAVYHLNLWSVRDALLARRRARRAAFAWWSRAMGSSILRSRT